MPVLGLLWLQYGCNFVGKPVAESAIRGPCRPRWLFNSRSSVDWASPAAKHPPNINRILDGKPTGTKFSRDVVDRSRPAAPRRRSPRSCRRFAKPRAVCVWLVRHAPSHAGESLGRGRRVAPDGLLVEEEDVEEATPQKSRAVAGILASLMGVSRRRSRFRLVGLAAFAGLLAVLWFGLGLGHGHGDIGAGLLFLGPALVLAMALFAGRYPGERVIERWRAARPAGDVRRAADAQRPRPRLSASRGGGRLIAVSLAGRAPPLAAGC